MGSADLHIHTIYSRDGLNSVSAVLKFAADHTPLDVIAITDHDQIKGALEAQELASAYGMSVIPGCEISTAEGHLLALYIHKRIPPRLSLIDTLIRVGDQGGICIAPHPMMLGANGLNAHSIWLAKHHKDAAPVFVGIEIYNAGLLHSRSNHRASKIADIYHLTKVAGSDAHLLQTIGHGAIEFPGRTAVDLRHALLTHQVRLHPNPGQGRMASIASLIYRYMLRSAGWVTWNAEPAAPLKLARMKQVRGSSPWLGKST
jgi:predicted metal-dependent phosphoesterase TrpH